MNIEDYREIGKEIEERLRLKSFPLAVKLLEEKESVPDNAERPLRDLGYHLPLCQAYQKSRREGTTMAMFKEDMWCFEPVVGYGLQDAPEYFLGGHNRYPEDVETLKAGRHYAEEFPRLEVGKYVGIVSAPLKETSFEPDLVMVYCDSEQLSLLLLGREYKKGYNLKCALSSHAACVYAVVPAIQNDRCQVAVPCRGDRYYAMADPDEMIMTIPSGKLEELMTGLRHVAKTDSKLPHGRMVKPEYELSESYEKIAKIMGFRGEPK